MKALARRSAAIVPAQIKKGEANLVEFASEEIAADVRVLRFDQRNRSRMYAVRLASRNFDVSGHLIGVLPGGELVDLGSLAVARGSIGGAHLRVGAPRITEYEAIYLEIRSEKLLLRVEAPRPATRTPARFGIVGIIGSALAACVLCTGLSVFAFVPQPLLSAPSHAVAGTTVRLPYATRGFGTREFSARFDDGSPIKSGMLLPASGEIELALTTAAARRRIVVALTQRALLGTRAISTTFGVDAPPAPPPPRTTPARVSSLSARRDQSANIETVLVSYLATGDRGTVALVAPTGTVVASLPFGHIGTSRLNVPGAYRTTPLVARLTVHRGASEAVASVALPAGVAAPVMSQDATAPEAVTPADPALTRETFQGIVGFEGRALAGRPLNVRIMAQLTSVHAELQDTSGGTIVERDVTPGATRFTLPLPPASTSQTYYLILRYTRNQGEETVVRAILAAVR